MFKIVYKELSMDNNSNFKPLEQNNKATNKSDDNERGLLQ